MQAKNSSFFEKLARSCARRPWLTVITWVVLLAIGAALFATVFTKNMTTVTEFTTDTDSKKADDLFKARFPQAAYKVENAVITSNAYTADDREFWAYVDDLYARLQPLRDSGVVKDVQYYDQALREGLPLMPGLLQEMVNAMELALDEESTTAELAQAAADLQASAAHVREVANRLTNDLTASGAEARDGMLEAADGAEELAGSLLLGDALEKLHDALSPIVAEETITEPVLRATAAGLRETAPALRSMADQLETTGPGTPARPILISGLRDTANGLEEVAGLYWLRDGIIKTNDALRPIADGQAVTTETCRATAQMLLATAPELRAAAAALEATGPGTVDQRPVLIAGLRDTANGLEEVAGLYWLRDGITKTYNALKPIVYGQTITTETCRTTVAMLNSTAPELRAAADLLEATGPGTPEERPTLIAGLRDTADGLEEVGGLYWLHDGLTKSYNALRPLAYGQYLTDQDRDATTTALWNTAPEMRAEANFLTARTGTSARADLISGLRQSADGLEELAGLYELKNCAQKGLEFALMMTPDPLPTAEQVDPAVDEMPITVTRLRDAVARLEATAPGTSARPELIDGLDQAADELEANLSNAEMLRGLVDGRPWTDLILYLALLIAQPTIEEQAATAQDGLAQIQSQSAANIGQVEDGLAEIRTQCADNFGTVEAGLDELERQCRENLAVAADGLTQLKVQCSDQISSVSAGITQMRTQFTDQLPTARAGVEQARSGAEQAAGLVSPDRRTALFAISMSEDADEAASHITELRKAVLTGNGIGLGEDSFVDGFRVRMVGSSNVSRDMQDVAMSDLMKSLSVAIPIALVILILVFGTLAAAMLPLVLSIVSIIVALGIAAAVGIWMPLTFAIENIVFMLGLALGIDHSLFLAYRYREERRKGLGKIDAIAKSGATAGHAMFYAGFIVVIALFGIFMIPCNMHKSLALGAIIVVGVIAAASITLLPAVLSLIGNRFDFGRLPWQKRITDMEQPGETRGGGFWHWVTRPAMKFTIVSFVLCAAIIVVCLTPMFHMRLGYSYVDTLPPTCISRSGYNAMIEAGYPPFLVAPLEIAIDGYDKPEVKAETEALVQRLEADGGFVTAVPLEVNEAGDVAWKRVFLNMDPFTAEASNKVKQLRNDLIGDSFTEAGGRALVTGYGAFNNDFVAVTENYTTPVLIFVLGLSLLLLMVAFRSILFAIVCTAFNLLSVYAAYGLVVFVFQDGHGLGLYKQIQGIDAYVPIFLLCGLFGISMDYFVFVMSRNRERYDETGDMSEAIMYSFRRTGLVVLGAAGVMLVVFFAFSISQIVIVAELGFGLVVAVLIDATLITLVMSPASMKLLGKWFWWWPACLSWVPDLRARFAHDRTGPGGYPETGAATADGKHLGYATGESGGSSPPRWPSN
ncbi:MAG: MMPL family transporter [Dehalococcoidia bacterium]|nr:MMPL family transporter [Dehalococcoidia bacterium]